MLMCWNSPYWWNCEHCNTFLSSLWPPLLALTWLMQEKGRKIIQRLQNVSVEYHSLSVLVQGASFMRTVGILHLFCTTSRWCIYATWSQTVHYICMVSRFGTQFLDSENVQHNLRLARLLILRNVFIYAHPSPLVRHLLRDTCVF